MITIEVRGTKVTSTKNTTKAGAKAAFQKYLVNRYNCSDFVAAAWIFPKEVFGLSEMLLLEHYEEAEKTFTNLPKEIVL